jgi:signal transduction histidine kinase
MHLINNFAVPSWLLWSLDVILLIHVVICFFLLHRKTKYLKKENRKKEEEIKNVKMVGPMLTTISHEINNPLMIIGGYAEVLVKKIEQEKEQKQDVRKRIESTLQTLEWSYQNDSSLEASKQRSTHIESLSIHMDEMTQIDSASYKYLEEKLNKIGLEVQRIHQVIQKMKDMRQLVIDSYTNQPNTIVDLNKSS